jgi:hypothetical protein
MEGDDYASLEVSTMPSLLTEATVQEIQLELIRRTQFNAFDGERVGAALVAHRDLWEAVLMDRFCLSNPGRLPSLGLIKLRDLSSNYWNVDTLYILCPDAASARQLAGIAETEDWGGMVQVHDDAEEVESALGSARRPYAVVSVWWD